MSKGRIILLTVNYGDQLLFLIKMELRCTAAACIPEWKEKMMFLDPSWTLFRIPGERMLTLRGCDVVLGALQMPDMYGNGCVSMCVLCCVWCIYVKCMMYVSG